jgi:hypothetical protein
MGAYSYLTFGQLQTALLERLQDTAAQWTSFAEAQIYITEALRVLNANTAIWNIDYTFDFNPGDQWKSLNVAGSPRQRTVTDAQVEIQMEYMLLEPPSGQVWSGTTQFSIDILSNALQYRRDEILQLAGANPVQQIQDSPILAQRSILSDSTLELRRVRWIPDAMVSSVAPYALWREDVGTTDAFGALLPIEPGAPDSWLVTNTNPLAFDVACPPNAPGQWDMLALYAGDPFTPPVAQPLNIPDDWSWVAMYGALADALANAPEARDELREKYCRMRYQQGLRAMMALPWLIEASVTDIPVDTPSFKEMDDYAQNWENTWPTGDPQIVVGGMDFVALAPFVTTATVSSVLTVVGNAPVDQANPVQLGRDQVDQVLNYAQHIALFKNGGADFAATFPLLKEFEDYCAKINRRYAALGIMRPDMLLEGLRADEIDPRFTPPEKEVKRGEKAR